MLPSRRLEHLIDSKHLIDPAVDGAFSLPPCRRPPSLMPLPARVKAADYPSMELLCELCEEIESSQQSVSSASILDLSPNAAFPQPLGPCFELRVAETTRSSFVLSQRRSGNVMYVTVTGKRSPCSGKGHWKKRSKVAWPRTRGTDRLRPITLHRWICMAMRGEPLAADMEAAHICGNDLCIASSHLQWQTRRDNGLDRRFHNCTPAELPRTRQQGKKHYSRLPWMN